MPKSRAERERSPFGLRMWRARNAAGLTQQQACRAVGVSQSTLTEAESTGTKSGHVAQFAKLYGVDAHWLATGEGAEPQWPGEAVAISPFPVGVAHPMSQARPILIPEIVPWEALVMGELPERFTLQVQDDAMAPALRRGGQAICSRAGDAAPGDLVVVVDADGHGYLRRYQVGRVGHWQAVADAPGFAALDSQRDSLQVVARVVGALWA